MHMCHDVGLSIAGGDNYFGGVSIALVQPERRLATSQVLAEDMDSPSPMAICMNNCPLAHDLVGSL